MITVLVATKDGKLPQGLEHIPNGYTLMHSTAPGWANASNELLDRAAEIGEDVLFLDDDVTLTRHTFDLLDTYYDKADVFGFTLITPDRNGNWTLASAGHYLNERGALLPRQNIRDVMTPCYIAHVTTSAIYLKADVVQAGIRFPVWPGVHCEDVAFTFDCWLHGFKVAYVPGVVEHPLSTHNVGFTKAGTPELQKRLMENKRMLDVWCEERRIVELAQVGKLPFGTWELK